MRFQQVVEDRPTRLPISATEWEASCCRRARILRSMASIAANPASEINAISDGGGRMISSLPGVFEVYLEDYSPATEIRRQRAALPACGARRPLASRQQGVDLGAARGCHAAAQTRAFEPGRGRGELQRRDHVAAFRERERERAVEHVTCAKGVD